MKRKPVLRRYTDLPGLIYLLSEKKITLLDPQTWDDRNDSYYLEVYRDQQTLKSVLAVCFTQASETYHHWRVFASGSSGVCITFRRDTLLKTLRNHIHLRTGRVKYMKLAKIKHAKVKTADLPFLKRYPYEDEREFRIIFDSEIKKSSMDISIPLKSCIERITLSPWLPHALSSHVKQVIRSIRDCEDIPIARSTLISNEEWKNLGERARH